MKSQIKLDRPIERPTPQLPALYDAVSGKYKTRKKTIIVLFTTLTDGVVVYSTDDECPVGHMSTSFLPCNEPSVWERVPDECVITLSNG